MFIYIFYKLPNGTSHAMSPPSWSHSLRQTLQVSLVMQYCSGGTLESAIHTDGPFSESRFQERENVKCLGKTTVTQQKPL